MKPMKLFRPTRTLALLLLAGATSLAGGCRHHYYLARELYQPPPAVAPLSTISDPIWQSQEARAEASEFVVNMHDFEYQSPMLNFCGKSHVTQIAARLQYCPNMPVVIEPSMGAVDEETQFRYPVHPNPELDLKRREMVVLALSEMGVHDADKRVLVAPAWAEAFTATEATQVYNQALSGAGAFGGFGGGFGGFGSSFGGGGFGFGGF
jgi:hypothetical protein